MVGEKKQDAIHAGDDARQRIASELQIGVLVFVCTWSTA
jgi:hypothetical protein